MKPTSLLVLVLAAAGCSRTSSVASQGMASSSGSTTVAPPGSTPTAVVGAAAPDFTLTDLDGKSVTLSSFKGKTVVLEWFNPGCPFVRKAHTVGSLKDAPAKAIAKGVVWLAINSSAPGKQGSEVDMNRKVAAEYGMSYPILLDASGRTGRTYGATNTPGMVVIDPLGAIVYRGAIDNSPDAEGQSPTDGKLVNYVDAALEALGSHQAIKTPETKAYGCGVKYGSS
jgi:peroxiredoxin